MASEKINHPTILRGLIVPEKVVQALRQHVPSRRRAAAAMAATYCGAGDDVA